MSIGLKINELAEKKNLPLTELAHRLGKTKQAIYDLVKKNDVNTSIVRQCALIFDVPVSYFFDEDSSGQSFGTSEWQNVETILNHESTHRLADPEQPSLPLIPVEAIAGFGVQQFQDLPIEGYYQVAEFSSADFLVRVKGDSMTPKYNAGDIIACKKVQDILFFQWGHIYVVDTKSQGMMVKRVRQAESSDRIELESENPNYDPFEIPLSDINSIALVMGAITLE